MNTPIETVEYKNHTISIHYDDCPGSPREMDNLGVFVTCERRYNSPDKINIVYDGDSVGDLLMNILCDISLKNIDAIASTYEETYSYIMNESQLRDKYEAIIRKHAILLRVYKYEHSGVAYSTTPFSCGWDSGHTGYIYIPFAKVKSEYGCKYVTKKIRERAEAVISNEVEIYSKWANGNVYGYTVTDEDGEEAGACWGYYSEEDAIEAAKEDAACSYKRVTQLEYFASANI